MLEHPALSNGFVNTVLVIQMSTQRRRWAKVGEFTGVMGAVGMMTSQEKGID